MVTSNKVIYYRASPHEKSKEKGQCQKIILLCLFMTDTQSTGHESNFLSSLFFLFGTILATWVGNKKSLFLKNQISKVDFSTLTTKFAIKNYMH